MSEESFLLNAECVNGWEIEGGWEDKRRRKKKKKDEGWEGMGEKEKKKGGQEFFWLVGLNN